MHLNNLKALAEEIRAACAKKTETVDSNNMPIMMGSSSETELAMFFDEVLNEHGDDADVAALVKKCREKGSGGAVTDILDEIRSRKPEPKTPTPKPPKAA